MRRSYLVVVLSLAMVAGCGVSATSSDAPSKWSAPELVGHTAYSSLYGVSCPSSSVCVTVDENGSAHLWRNGAWSASQRTQAGGTLTSVSCPTTKWCVAASAGGESVTFDGTSWSSPISIGPSANYNVSCPTSTFCAAIGTSGTPGAPSIVGTFNGRSWTSSETTSTGAFQDRLMDVSCASPTMCVAVNLDGRVLTFNGTTWSTGRNPLAEGLLSVSCPTTSFCAAVSASGHFTTFNGTTWSKPTVIPGLQIAFSYAVSCGSPSTCTVLGLSGRSADWNRGRWSHPTSVFPGKATATVSLSCADSRHCMAVNAGGFAAIR